MEPRRAPDERVLGPVLGRDEIDSWDRVRLEQEAGERGVQGIGTMTRSELVKALRGRMATFWNRAVNKVRNAVQDRRGGHPIPPEMGQEEVTSETVPTEPIRTRTLARVLASQGQYARSLAIYEELRLASPFEPELANEEAGVRALELSALCSAPDSSPYDHIEAVSFDRVVHVTWQLLPESYERARVVLGSGGVPGAKLSVFSCGPDQEMQVQHFETHPVELSGRWQVPGIAAGSRCTAAVGITAHGRFVSAVHSPVFEVTD